MAAALHDPERGYYARHIRGIGRAGDFSTTASISIALARAVASWANAALRDTRTTHLIELGPGDGTLAKAVIKELPWLLRRKIVMHLVDTSKPLVARQQSNMPRGIVYHETIESALTASDSQACIYSNEFVDAFPVRRFRRRQSGWDELYLTSEHEDWRPVEQLPPSAIFERRFSPGQIVEVNQSYHRWLTRMLPNWTAGRMLTIDYGAEYQDLYQRQPEGSLRAYFHHQRLTGSDVYQNPGRFDLTADVNFTDLIAWPADDLASVRLQTQAEFLSDFVDSRSHADRFAVESWGAGTAFLCLDQKRIYKSR